MELVKSPSQFGRPQFLIWNAGQAKVEEFFHYGGSQFVPPSMDLSLLRATRLPTGVTPCGNAAELLLEIAQCISEYIELAPEHLRLVSHFVLCTWFQDRLSSHLTSGDWSLQCGQNALAQSPACVLSACCYGERYFSGGVVLSSQRNHADVAHR